MTSDTLRVALAQVDYRVGDVERNLAAVEASVERAKAADADLLVCSELALSGYPPRDLLTRDAFVDAQLAAVDRAAALTDEDLSLVVGHAAYNPADRGNRLVNVASVCHAGDVVGRAVKRLLPTYDVFDEDRYFAAGATTGPVDLDGVSIGLSVCEDAWSRPDVWDRPLYHTDPVADLAAAGADVLVNVSASPFALGKPDFRRKLMGDHARDHGLAMVFANQVGATDDLVFDGRSLVVGPDGRVVAEAAAFEEDFLICDVPVPVAVPVAGNSNDDGDGTGPRVYEHDRAGSTRPESWAGDAVAAVELGIRDYVEKTGFSGVVLGLSGGIDSSLTATLAARALGSENVLGVAMPTRYSSSASAEDARELAERLDIDFRVVQIDDAFETVLDGLAPAFEDYEHTDLAEENVQARLRGVVLMALSNASGRLVLAPGNKSELAVGYTTLYGDMVGAVAPIADCYKTLVYEMAETLNRRAEAAGETPPIPDRVIKKPPSAELRPDQTDRDDLPPYAVLDEVLSGYVDEGMSATELVEAGHDPDLVAETVERLHRNEYKRRQAAPPIQVTEKAFGTGWRYPLAAGYDALSSTER
jgi:NAD+ synthetase